MTKFSTLTLLAAVAAVLPAPAMAEDLVFKLANNSSYTITNFYTSPATTDNWEEDVFGQDTLAPGSSVNVTIGDGSDQCTYDMKFVPEGAAEFVVNGIDLCKLDGNTYTLSDAK